MQVLESPKFQSLLAFLFGLVVTFALITSIHGAALPVADSVPVAASAGADQFTPVLAAVVVPAGDPIANPSGWYDVFRSAVGTSHVLAALVALLALLRVLGSRVPWLRIGWRVPVAGAASALLLTLIQTWPADAHQWVQWLVSAALAVALMLFQPTPVPVPAPALRDDPDAGGQRK